MENYKLTGICLNTWKVFKKEVRVKTKFKFKLLTFITDKLVFT